MAGTCCLWKIIFVLSSLFIAGNYAKDSNNATDLDTYQNATDPNTTSVHNYMKKHVSNRSVLIINDIPILRSSSKSKDQSKKKKSLLYIEYGDDGKQLNSFMMYNLDDVEQFFREFLDTEICYGKCDDDD